MVGVQSHIKRKTKFKKAFILSLLDLSIFCAMGRSVGLPAAIVAASWAPISPLPLRPSLSPSLRVCQSVAAALVARVVWLPGL